MSCAKLVFLKASLRIRAETFGAHSIAVVKLLRDLADASLDLGYARRVPALLERALSIQQQLYGPEHREVAVTLAHLGRAVGVLGRGEQQRDFAARALVIQERAGGLEAAEVASSFLTLVTALGDLGNEARKRDLLKRALRIAERCWREGTVVLDLVKDFPMILAGLGDACGYFGDPQGAHGKPQPSVCCVRRGDAFRWR